VLLPAPDEGPALTIYQEAGQFSGGGLRDCSDRVFAEKPLLCDSKTGRVFCPSNMQNAIFAQ
jgi:hypothetical protein